MKTVEGYWDSMQKTVTFSFLCLLSSVLAEFGTPIIHRGNVTTSIRNILYTELPTY